ncbi:conserved hypothetical protein [Magnetococcus marinus MC-1]|uniref:Uncharacterized protein n=1 Tax=Magnetococcus marinus (strain ATCC BAA-1437 / JCM 17883 / MC-1) TaxID=156889 RepID=A0L8M1_MAGMM|nr:hypothetical protein [Magnetococcus marinus]ABK44314.1 conserved hypothetical protein [Magnetococcus marinus MC-1]
MSESYTTALVVVRAEEGKRLIGQAVAQLPQVQRATQQGRMVVVGGSTTRYVAQALTGEDPGDARFAVGWIADGILGETPAQGRGPGPFIWEEGTLTRGWPMDVLSRFTAADVYIKGANALDAEGHAGILMASPTGGTIGAAYPILMARGAALILPVSLQKMVPGSVFHTASLLGQQRVMRSMGSPVGLLPIHRQNATIVTECQALHILHNLTATVVSAGGVQDCCGSLSLHLYGRQVDIEAAWERILQMR